MVVVAVGTHGELRHLDTRVRHVVVRGAVRVSSEGIGPNTLLALSMNNVSVKTLIRLRPAGNLEVGLSAQPLSGALVVLHVRVRGPHDVLSVGVLTSVGIVFDQVTHFSGDSL